MVAIQSEGSLNKKVRVYKKITVIQIKAGKERSDKIFLSEKAGEKR